MNVVLNIIFTNISFLMERYTYGVIRAEQTLWAGASPAHTFNTVMSKGRPQGSPLRYGTKSRRDGTLLTVDFNLRDATNAVLSLQVPQGRHFGDDIIVSSLQDFEEMLFSMLRRLKPTVNRMLSLRDISALTKHSTNPLFSINSLSKRVAPFSSNPY